MIKACLFDIFGTIVSAAKCEGFGMEDMPVSTRDGSLDILSNPGGGFSGMSPEANKERVRENTKTFFEQGAAQMPDMILPGALDFIKDLHRHGIKLAATSTSCHPEKVLSRVGLYGMFDYVADPRTVADRPDPEALLKAANHLGIPAEECIAIENTPEGLEAAQAAGMRSLAVGDLSELFHANMGVTSVKGLTLLKLKDGLEVSRYHC